MKTLNYLGLILLQIGFVLTASANVTYVSDLVNPNDGDQKFTKAIQAAIIKASVQQNGIVFIDAYEGHTQLDITSIRLYDFTIDNLCFRLSNHYNLSCNHLNPGVDGLIDLKNLTIIIDCGITINALKCHFKGFDEMLGFNGFKNFNIEGYGATFTMEGFDFYSDLAEIDQDNYHLYYETFQQCDNVVAEFCTTAGAPWQNTRNCRKPENNCLECWTGNHHPAYIDYEIFAQGRHGIHIANCKNVRIKGIKFENIFSDGINLDPGLDRYYDWAYNTPSRDIDIQDCAFINCGRVGVCFCSVNGASVRHSAFEHNGYIVAGVDIDVEPVDNEQIAVGISVEQCSFKEAANAAISIGPGGLTQTNSNQQVIQSPQQKLSMNIQDCVIAETEFGVHHAGGPYLANYADKVNINGLTIRKLGHEYTECYDLPAHKIQACKDSLDNFPRIGLLFDNRLTPNLVGDWTMWDVENLVMKELSQDENGHQFTWHSMPVFLRTTYFLDYFQNNKLGCAEDLTVCGNYNGTGFVYDELFGGISLKNMIIYDEHGAVPGDVRLGQPVSRQELCLVESPYLANAYFLPRFANLKTENITKVNPKNEAGVTNVLNANTFSCDLVSSTYNDYFQLHTSVAKPAVSVSSTSTSVNEGNIAYFTLSLSQTVSYPLSVDYKVKGSATNRLDYAYLTGNIIIPPYTTHKNISVKIHKDCTEEQSGGEILELEIITDLDETYQLNQKTAKTTIQDVSCNLSYVKTNCASPASIDENETPEPEDTQEETEESNEETSNQTGEQNENTNSGTNILGSLGEVGVKGGGRNTSDDDENSETETNTDNSLNACTDNTLFYTYPWLKQAVNLSQCNNDKITVYENDIYAFLMLENGTANNFYFQDGTMFCSQASSFDCLSYYRNLYNLKEGACWMCETTASCNVSGCTNNSACNYNPNACIDDGSCQYGNLVCDNPCDCMDSNEPSAPDWFSAYPILNDIVDIENCAGTSISIFDQVGFAYIAVSDASGTALYLDYLDAAPFCVNQTNYNCLSFYNLAVPTKTWQCTGNAFRQIVDVSSIDQKNNFTSIEVFPNPNNGLFQLFFNNKIPNQVNIYSLDGKRIYSAHLPYNLIQEVDLTTNGSGVYLVEVIYEERSEIRKVVVH